MDKSIIFDQVADIYDYYVTTDLDINFFLEEFKGKTGPVLELMCGTGRVSIPLIANGIQLTCVDYSSGMLKKLRDKLNHQGLGADLLEGDVRELELNKLYDYIFIPFNSFMELTDKASQLQALNRIHRHLNPNGIFICTLHNPMQRINQASGEKIFRGEFPLPDNRSLQLYAVEHYNTELKIVYGKQFFYWYDSQGNLEAERQLDIKFSLIGKAEFENMASSSGFTVLNLYGDYDRNQFDSTRSPFMIYYLGKAVQ
ncbi:MAG: class I SAM-dependent methyltransferase [Methylocystaceae bacterium]